MNTKMKSTLIAATTAAALLATSAIASIATAGDATKLTVSFSVTNVPNTITEASKIADRVIAIACPVDPALLTAPATIPCSDEKSRIELDESGLSLSSGTLTGTFSIEVPLAPVTFATYLQLKPSASLGYQTGKTSDGVLIPLDATSSSISQTLSLALPNPGTVSFGTQRGGKDVRVNLTVVNVPTSINRASKLEDAVRVCVVPLAADATTIVNQTITSCSNRNSAEVKAASLVNGVWSGTVKLRGPKNSGDSANYALYAMIRSNRERGFAAQYGNGQFVTITNDGGVAKVTAGLDGLTIDLAANTGAGANAKVVPVVVPDDGNSYAVLITRISDGKESAAAYIPVKVGDVSVTLPGNLKGGNYRAQLVKVSAGDLFTLDSKSFLDDEIKQLSHSND